MSELKPCPEYQEEMNELLRMKKQLLGPQGCSCQSQQRNEWKAHCLSAGIYALSQLGSAQPANEPLVRCENCIHWDKSISFLLSAHACAFWSASKRNPRYTEGYEFCSFAEAKPEGSENDGQTI